MKNNVNKIKREIGWYEPPGIMEAKKTLRLDNPIILASLVRFIRQEKTIMEIADYFQCGVKKVDNMLKDLENFGYNVEVTNNNYVSLRKIPLGEPAPITFDPKKRWGPETRFGIVTDTHLASKFQRLDILEEAYRDFKKNNIKTVYHCGNIVDGYSQKINGQYVYYRGITEQAQYALDYYPQVSGIETHYISAADHEGWYWIREGIDFGRYLELEAEKFGRNDLKWIGFIEQDLILKAKRGKAVIKLIHPGSGSAYAISYKSQKIVESLQGGEKPSILICGHYHKHDYCYPREVHVIQPGCVQDQTEFMRRKHLAAHVGYGLCKVIQAEDGSITSVDWSWRPFYDKKFHWCQRITSTNGNKNDKKR